MRFGGDGVSAGALVLGGGGSRAPAGALSRSEVVAFAFSEQEDVIRASGAHHILLAVSPSGLNRGYPLRGR